MLKQQGSFSGHDIQNDLHNLIIVIFCGTFVIGVTVTKNLTHKNN